VRFRAAHTQHALEHYYKHDRGCCGGAESFVFLIDPGAMKLTIRRSPALVRSQRVNLIEMQPALACRVLALSFYGMTFMGLILRCSCMGAIIEN
jgi:hypothetical protein